MRLMLNSRAESGISDIGGLPDFGLAQKTRQECSAMASGKETEPVVDSCIHSWQLPLQCNDFYSACQQSSRF